MNRRRRRARLGVTHKLWLSVVAMIAAVLVPVGIALDRGVTSFYYQQNTADLLRVGHRFAEFLARAPAQGASEAVRAIAEITGTPLLVLDRQGVTVAGSGELAAEVGKRAQNPRILSALQGEPSVFLAVDETLPGSLFVTSVPIRSGAEIAGAVVLFRSADSVRQAIARVRRLLASAAAALFLLLSTFGWLLSRRLVRPLLQMKNAADQMAQGEYTTRVQAPGSDELGELAASINRLAASLLALETNRRRFFANISHELRTPLSYLQGYADALAEGLASTPEEVRAYGRILADEARRLGRLVDDLFVLAQAEEGRLSLKMAEVDLASAIQRVIGRIRPRAEDKEIAIEVRLPPGAGGPGGKTQETARVVADSDRLEQILLNLLDNAIRHTPAGGRVRISAWRLPRGWDLRKQRLPGDPPGPLGDGRDQRSGGLGDSPAQGEDRLEQIVVIIDDSGPGLADDPERVWERFYRGDRSRNRDLGGTGLGLAIVRGLVEAQGGQVWAEAHGPLGGARFAFSLQAPA